MKLQEELWECNLGCGNFWTRADMPKCPRCHSRKVSYLRRLFDRFGGSAVLFFIIFSITLASSQISLNGIGIISDSVCVGDSISFVPFDVNGSITHPDRIYIYFDGLLQNITPNYYLSTKTYSIPSSGLNKDNVSLTIIATEEGKVVNKTIIIFLDNDCKGQNSIISKLLKFVNKLEVFCKDNPLIASVSLFITIILIILTLVVGKL